MTWGEIQIESLRKMFLNSDIISIDKLDEYKTDKKYKTYLDMMPQASNEAINYILENGRPCIQNYELEKDNNLKYKLNDLIPNFKRLYEISYTGNGKLNYRLEGNNCLVLKSWDEGDITIYYEAYLDRITHDTPNDEVILLDDDLSTLIPLYIAGELYKDDDISMATQYLNEFMNQISMISNKNYGGGQNSIETVYSMNV